MTRPILSPAACQALERALATRGKNKGLLLATAPSVFKDPLANAAWNAAMLACNPYKVSIMSMMLASVEQRAIFDEVVAFIDSNPSLRHLDRDRAALERLGVW